MNTGGTETEPGASTTTTGLTPEVGLPIRIKTIQEAIDSRDSTLRARLAYQQGKAGTTDNGSCSRLAFYITYNIYAPFHLLPQKLIDTGKHIVQDWEGLRNSCLREYARETELVPTNEDPVKYVEKMLSMEPDKNRQAWAVYDQVIKLAARHPQASGMLDRQLRYEEQVLAHLAPYYQEISPSEVEYLHLVYTKEPRNIDEAIAEVKDTQSWTRQVLEGFTKSGGSSLIRTDDLLLLMKQDGFFASFIPPQLLEEARIMQIRLEGQLPSKKDAGYILAQVLLYDSPNSPEYYQKRLIFEGKLRAALEAQKSGALFPGPTSVTEVRNFVEITSRWTQISTKTFAAHDLEGWRGGFNHFYRWLCSRESLKYLPEDLVEKGKALWQKWGMLKREATSLAIRKTWGVDLGSTEPEETLRQIDDAYRKSINISTHTHAVRARAEYLLLSNPRSLAYLKEQAGYEEELLRHKTLI